MTTKNKIIKSNQLNYTPQLKPYSSSLMVRKVNQIQRTFDRFKEIVTKQYIQHSITLHSILYWIMYFSRQNGRSIYDYVRFYVLITLSIMFTITFLGNGIICGLNLVTNDTISKHLCYNMTEISVSILRFVRSQ